MRTNTTTLFLTLVLTALTLNCGGSSSPDETTSSSYVGNWEGEVRCEGPVTSQSCYRNDYMFGADSWEWLEYEIIGSSEKYSQGVKGKMVVSGNILFISYDWLSYSKGQWVSNLYPENWSPKSYSWSVIGNILTLTNSGIYASGEKYEYSSEYTRKQ